LQTTGNPNAKLDKDEIQAVINIANQMATKQRLSKWNSKAIITNCIRMRD